MSTEVKYFNSSMVNSPVVSGTMGSLIAMLDACLVDGFGLKTCDSVVVTDGIATASISTGHSAQDHCVVLIAGATPAGLNGEKRVLSTTVNTVTFDATGISNQTASGTITLKIAPAGWGKAFAGTNKAAYRSPNVECPRHYFRFDDTGTYTAKVRGYEAMTDIDTGTGLFPDATNYPTGTHFFRSGAGSPNAVAKDWIVIANDKFVFVANRGYTTGTTYAFEFAVFGHFKSRKSGDAYRSLLKGNYGSDSGGNTNGTNAVTYSSTDSTYAAYAARDHVGMGGFCKINTIALSPIYASHFISGAGSMPYPNPADYGLLLSRMVLVENGTSVMRGEIPGLFVSPQNMQNRFCPNAATPVMLTDVPDLPGRVVVAVPIVYSNSNYGVAFFDITGPWGN